MNLIPRMSRPETALLQELLRQSKSLVEYGSGGSTIAALQAGVTSIRSVETDMLWIQALKADPSIAEALTKGQVELMHADIGPIGEWGMPLENVLNAGWLRYPMTPWKKGAEAVDLVLIDGRFRVASALTSALMAGPDARILIHDLSIRPQYKAAFPFLDSEQRVDGLGVFRLKKQIDMVQLNLALHKAYFDYM